MIAPFRTEMTDKPGNCTYESFQAMLPQIRRQASIKLRHLRTEAREEFVAEVVARALRFARLVEQGRPETARPTPLVIYAIRQVRAGRRVGCRQNSRMYCLRRPAGIHGSRSNGSIGAILMTELGTNSSLKTAEPGRPKQRRLAWI